MHCLQNLRERALKSVWLMRIGFGFYPINPAYIYWYYCHVVPRSQDPGPEASWFDCMSLAASKYYKHIEAKTNWPPFCRWHFAKHFHEWNCMNFAQVSTNKSIPMWVFCSAWGMVYISTVLCAGTNWYQRLINLVVSYQRNHYESATLYAASAVAFNLICDCTWKNFISTGAETI